MRWLTVATVLMVSLLPGVCAAQFYKWVDEQGNVHYSDSPPENRDYQVVEGARSQGDANAPTAAERLKRWRASQEERAARRAQQEAAEEEARREQQELEDACRTARRNLDVLIQSNRILLPPEQEDGEPIRMPDDERMRRIEEFRAAIDENCS